MNFFDGLWLLILGVLAVPNLVLSKQPDAKKVLDKITPYQGWIGLISGIYGIIRIPYLFSGLSLFKLGLRGILLYAILAVFVVTQTLLGFILGVGVLKTFVKDPTAQGKLDQTLAKIIPYQATLGLLAIADGAIIFINSFAHVI